MRVAKMADFLMIEVKGWLDNLRADADKRGLPTIDMMFLLIEAIEECALKVRAEHYRLLASCVDN